MGNFFHDWTIRIRPMRGAVIATILHYCAFVAVYVKDPWGGIFPIAVAAPTSIIFLGILQPNYLGPIAYMIVLIIIGIVNGGFWFGIIFVILSVPDWISRLCVIVFPTKKG